MVVYWDLAAAWDFMLDYLLLLGAARLAGQSVRQGRLALSAALGALYSVATLVLEIPAWTLAPALLGVCAVAYAKTGRAVKLTLLFALLACALGGAVLALGAAFGSVEHLAHCLLGAHIPWGVFFAAAGASMLLQCTVFRGFARHADSELVRVRIEYGGRDVAVTLLRDTGNELTDPLTGEGVPIIEKAALSPLLEGGGAEPPALLRLRCNTVGGAGTELDAFRCDALSAEGRSLGARLVAISPGSFGGRYGGLWFGEEREEALESGLEASVG